MISWVIWPMHGLQQHHWSTPPSQFWKSYRAPGDHTYHTCLLSLCDLSIARNAFNFRRCHISDSQQLLVLLYIFHWMRTDRQCFAASRSLLSVYLLSSHNVRTSEGGISTWVALLVCEPTCSWMHRPSFFCNFSDTSTSSYSMVARSSI